MNRFNFFNISINDFTKQSLINHILDICSKRQDKPIFIANHNLHSLYYGLKNPDYMQIINEADFIHADGMSIILIAKLFGIPLHKENRITYLDFAFELFSKMSNMKIFYLGTTKEILEVGLSKIKQRTSLQVYGHNGFDDNYELIISKINNFKPDILFVGLGMPKQEYWINMFKNELDVKVILNCGCFIDYIAEYKKEPPRWIGKIGLEWLYRFLCEPKRLFSRYFIEPLFILKEIFLFYR